MQMNHSSRGYRSSCLMNRVVKAKIKTVGPLIVKSP